MGLFIFGGNAASADSMYGTRGEVFSFSYARGDFSRDYTIGVIFCYCEGVGRFLRGSFGLYSYMVESITINVGGEAFVEVSLSNDASASNVGERVLFEGATSDVRGIDATPRNLN